MAGMVGMVEVRKFELKNKIYHLAVVLAMSFLFLLVAADTESEKNRKP